MDNLAHPVHKFCLYRDGNAWCAVGPGFIDIMASPVGFGLEQIDAVREFQAAWRKPGSNQRDLTVADFVICSDNPRRSGEGEIDLDKSMAAFTARQMAKPFEDRNFE